MKLLGNTVVQIIISIVLHVAIHFICHPPMWVMCILIVVDIIVHLIIMRLSK